MGKQKKKGLQSQKKKQKEFAKFSLRKANFKQKNEIQSPVSKNLLPLQMETSEDLNINFKLEPNADFSEIKHAIKDNSCKVYNKEFRKVIEQADVLLEVLDARDPLGTRCYEIEKMINDSPERKPIIIILNKADLVSTENLRKWLKYFKSIHPALPFKSSTQKQTFNYGSKSFKSIKDEKYLQNSVSFGTDLLMTMLGKYFRHKGAGVKITVGVVGIPNVGKSSIINSLARGKRCAIGCKPGVTRSLQKIHIDKKVMLIDSPGIIFPNAHSLCSVYQNGQNVGDIRDPIVFAENILKRASKEYFCTLYGVSDYSSFEEFLSKKALKMGKFISGSPDTEAAARGLLNDWNSGKIRYSTEPPENSTSSHVTSRIISSEKMEDDEYEDNIEKILKDFVENTIPVKPSFKIPEASAYQINKMSESNAKNMEGNIEKVNPVTLLEGNRSINKDIKRLQKKKKKVFARTERKIDQMSDVLQGFTIETENCMMDD